MDAGGRQRPRVLIVDDEPRLGVSLQILLSSEHDAVVAGSGREAQELLVADGAFDVILCDLMMPDVSGIDLHRWIAARDPRLARRMIFMSGGAFTKLAREFLETEHPDYLEKPFDPQKLVKTIRAVLSKTD